MTWLSRNTFSPVPQKRKLMSVQCDQVSQCSGSLTFSHISVTSMNDIPTIRGKKTMDLTQSHVSIT